MDYDSDYSYHIYTIRCLHHNRFILHQIHDVISCIEVVTLGAQFIVSELDISSLSNGFQIFKFFQSFFLN